MCGPVLEGSLVTEDGFRNSVRSFGRPTLTETDPACGEQTTCTLTRLTTKSCTGPKPANAGVFVRCAKHGTLLEGESPLRALMTGTASRTARASSRDEV